MKISPTQLMKELKLIQLEIAQIHITDERDSSVPVDCDYLPRYESEYSYENNREKIRNLQEREAKIHSILNVFNMTTKVDGYDFKISEALVRLAQLRSEIKVLTPLASQPKIHASDYSSRYSRSDEIYKSCYDIDKVKMDLKKLQQEFSALQVAVDKTNLNSCIDN